MNELIVVNALAILDACGADYMAVYNGVTFHNLDKDKRTKPNLEEKRVPTPQGTPFTKRTNIRKNTTIIDRKKWVEVRNEAYKALAALNVGEAISFTNETHKTLSAFAVAVSGIMRRAHGVNSYKVYSIRKDNAVTARRIV